MRDDAALLVGGDNQGRQMRGLPARLQRRYLAPHRLQRASRDVVPGDIDAPDQSLVRETRNLLERGVTDDEMLPEFFRTCRLGPEDNLFADRESNGFVQHRQWREDPQQGKELCHPAPTAPAAAPQQYERADNAHRAEDDVAGSAQRQQNGIVLVEADRQQQDAGEPERDDAETVEDFHGTRATADHATSCESERRISTARAMSLRKSRLHEICMKILDSCKGRPRALQKQPS